MNMDAIYKEMDDILADNTHSLQDRAKWSIVTLLNWSYQQRVPIDTMLVTKSN